MADGFTVLIYSNEDARSSKPDAGTLVKGFPTENLATEYARRWLRDSIEKMRRPGQSLENLRLTYYQYGENVVVLGGAYRGSNEVEEFLASPASPEERDYHSIAPSDLPAQPLWTEESPQGFSAPECDFELRIEKGEELWRNDYGDQQFRKTYVFSRPIAGIHRIVTDDGLWCRSLFSLDRRFLLIGECPKFWLFDIQKDRVLHRAQNPDQLYYFSFKAHGNTIVIGQVSPKATFILTSR